MRIDGACVWSRNAWCRVELESFAARLFRYAEWLMSKTAKGAGFLVTVIPSDMTSSILLGPWEEESMVWSAAMAALSNRNLISEAIDNIQICPDFFHDKDIYQLTF